MLLAAIGVAGGYAYADLQGSSPTGSGAGAPASASDPSYPSTPEDDVKPPSDIPPLPDDVELTRTTLGRPGVGIRLSVPSGWARTDQTGRIEARWRVSDEPGTYSVRVSVDNATRANPEAQVAAKIARLQLDGTITELNVEEQGSNYLIFSYIQGGYRVLQVDRFVSLDGGPAQVEIATSGRLVDEPGMRALVNRMAVEVSRLPKTAGQETQ